MRRLVAITLLVAACSPTPPDQVLAADGITVTIGSAPYRLTLRDASGRTVLASRPTGGGDGYGSVGWTSGQIDYETGVSPGYFTISKILDGWRDRFEVVSSVREGDDTVVSTLTAARARRTIHVKHQIRDGALRVEATTVDGQPVPRAWAASFVSPADERFIGFGERFNRVDQRGKNVYAWLEEGGLGKAEEEPAGPDNPYPSGELMTYYPVPFFLSSAAYAFWLDSTWYNEFRLATDHDDAWQVFDAGPRLAYEVYLPRPSDERPWPYQVVDAFTARTGRPMVPPPWAYGPRRRIGRGSMKSNGVAMVPEIQAMRDLDLAITGADDAMHFLPAGSDIGIEDELRAWTDAGHRLGYKVMGYYNSLFASDPSPLSSTVERGLANNYFLRDKNGVPLIVFLISGRLLNVYQIDFTQVAARAFFAAELERALALGYDGWMWDFGEYVAPEALTSDGRSGEEYHNRYPVEYDRAGHDALEARRPGEWFFFARSGYTGSQQWTPFVWGGDPEASFSDALGVPSVVRAAINMGLVAVANWGSDIGGFKCFGGGAKADGELWARWIQIGSMHPNMQDQDACSGNTGGTKQSIWTAPVAMAAWKRYARLHTRLFPTFWALAHEAHATGAPIVRSLFFVEPTPEMAAIDDEFLVGPGLLVAPVVKRGATAREVRFPSGTFVDLERRGLHRGTTVAYPAPVELLPLFLREGTAIVLLDETIDTLADEDDPAIVSPKDVAEVYDVIAVARRGGAEAGFTLADGSRVAARATGDFAAPAGWTDVSVTPEALRTCTECYARLDEGRTVRLATRAPTTTAGGVTLTNSTGRRIRWDLTLIQ
jgi:alpha-glucosidase (family GH31 glycosyl hydrolase)